MADNEAKQQAPILDEVAAITQLDIGAQFAEELRVASDEILKSKGGDLVVYEGVLRDEQCYSAFKQLRTDIVARETIVEPGGNRPIDIDAAEDLKLHLARIGWDAVTHKMLTGVWYGYSPGECMFSVDKTHVNLDEVRVRKARRFRFDKDGRVRLIRTGSPQGLVMPDNKFWVFRADADDDDDPYPLGLGYYCYWPVWFKRNFMRFWALWGEKFASPTPLVKFPPASDDAAKAKALSIAKKILSGASIAIPANVLVDMLEALARAGDDYERFCKYADAANTKIILCQTMTTDNGSSYAQSQTHADVKGFVSKSYSDRICESFMRGPGTWLTNWNFPGAAIPKVYRDYSESEDLKLVAERDERLKNVGYRPTAKRVADVYGDGYELVSDGQPSRDGSATSVAPTATQSFAEGASPAVVGPAEDAIERLIGGDGWERVIGPEVDAVAQFLEGATSLDDVRNRIGELSARDPGAVTESLARVMFAANVAGQLGVEVDDV